MTEIRRCRPLLGTYVEISVHACRGDAGNAVNHAFAAMGEIHDLMSFQDPGSELSRLNRSPGRALRLHPHLKAVLRLAVATARCSGELFNCTVGGELVLRGLLPDHGAPGMVPRGSVEDIEFKADRVRLRRPVRVTLDGIAKGYAVDMGIRALRQRGVTAGCINAGGDLRVFGDVSLPIQRRLPNGELEALGRLAASAMATSVTGPADHDRFPARIIPARGSATTPTLWTVIARSAWRADALSKVAALAPDRVRQALLQRLGGRLVGMPGTAMV